MPLVLSKKKVKKVLTSLLKEKEEIDAILVTRGLNRSALVLTDQKRLLITDIPLVGHSRVKEEYHVDEIQGVDFFPGFHVISLIIKVKEQTIVVKLPLSLSRFPVKEELEKFTVKIREMNPGARPEYMEKNENIVEIINVKQDLFKLTENHIFLFKPSGSKTEGWEINEKIPFQLIREFDYYPEAPDLLYFYIENERGDSRLYKIEHPVLFFNEHTGDHDPDLIVEKIFESLAPYRKKPAPSYLHDDEEVITTLRASDTVSGVVSQGIILRLTNKRLIDLNQEKQGRLYVKTEIDLGSIKNKTIKRHVGNRAGEGGTVYYILSIQLADNKTYEYWIDKEYMYAVNKLFVYLEDKAG